MLNSISRGGRTIGKHRKQGNTTARTALVAVAAGAVSTAGAGSIVAAGNQASTEPAQVEYTLANNSEAAPFATNAAPQILTIPEAKPTVTLNEQLGKAVQYSSHLEAISQAMRTPVVVKPAEGAFTSGFGPRWGSMHNGIDIAGPVGTPILAAMDGTVVDSGPAQGYGNWVRIAHADGSITTYGHMETIDVVVGQVVTAGQKIAGMGNRGISTGSHLHFEIQPFGSGPIDPAAWLSERGITL